MNTGLDDGSTRSAIVVASLLFAYGTLMPADRESAAQTAGRPMPCAGGSTTWGPIRPWSIWTTPGPAGSRVSSERSSKRSWRAVRRWEEVDAGLYRRVETMTRNDNRVWVYVYARPLPADARRTAGALASRGQRSPIDATGLFGQGDHDGEHFAPERDNAQRKIAVSGNGPAGAASPAP